MSKLSMQEEAWNRAIAGEPEPALRGAIANVEDDALQLYAVLLLARTLIAEGRSFSVPDALEKLADAFVRRGDLPASVACAKLADDAGGEGAKIRNKIAEAFGKGSKRIADVSPAPPPLPTSPAI